MKIAALSLLVAFAVAGANARGEDRCTWGPSYWCRSVKEASECAATKYCIKHNWAQIPIKKETVDFCKICEDAVKDIRDIFTPEFEKDIETTWAAVCEIIPLAEIKAECQTIGTDYLPELFEMIKSALEPQQVCTAIGLCKAENVFAPFLPRLGDDCGDCTNFLSDIKRRCQEKGKDQVQEDIKGMCSIAQQYEGMCKQLIDQYMDKIYDHLINIDAPKLCKFGGMC